MVLLPYSSAPSTPEPLGSAQQVNAQHLTTVRQTGLRDQRISFLGTPRALENDLFTDARRSHQGLFAFDSLNVYDPSVQSTSVMSSPARTFPFVCNLCSMCGGVVGGGLGTP